MADYLWHNQYLFEDIPYKDFKLYFVAYDIITYEEKRSLDYSSHRDEKFQMRDVLSTIGGRLRYGRTKPFKMFLELLEESGDNRLQEKAKILGQWISEFSQLIKNFMFIIYAYIGMCICIL